MVAPPVLCNLPVEAVTQLVLLEAQCNAPAWNAELFLEEFQKSDSLIIGARAEGELIGYLVASWVLDEGSILKFGVAAKSRRLGVGRQLLNWGLEQLYFNGVKSVWLEVRVSNEPAQRLYLSEGFDSVGLRKGYYSDNGEDALVMKREFATDAVVGW